MGLLFSFFFFVFHIFNTPNQPSVQKTLIPISYKLSQGVEERSGFSSFSCTEKFKNRFSLLVLIAE
jgi:hypothetical protein